MIRKGIAKIRMNHALEHASIAVLLEQGFRPPLGGYSVPHGFVVFARASTERVRCAVHDAHDRLARGQHDLAVSPYCGTNLVTGALLAGVLTSVIMGRRGRQAARVPVAAAAIVGATLLSRPLGNQLQRRFTTLAEVQNLVVVDVRPLWSGLGGVHLVRTRVESG